MKIFLFFIGFIGFIGNVLANHKVSVSEIGGYLKIQNGGPFDYNIDLKDPTRPVDGSTQLLEIGTIMANPDPKRIYNIGLGMACYERHLLHIFPELSITSVDIDHETILQYAKYANKYFTGKIPKEELNPPRLTIHPGEGADMLKKIESTIVDIITVDILDSNWASPKNLLYDRNFFSHATEHLTDNGAIVVALNQAGINQIKDIKSRSGLKNAIHLTFQPGDKSAQAKFSVLVLSDNINCSKLTDSYEYFGTAINIQKPACKQI